MDKLRREIQHRLFWMGYDISDIMLLIPLQAVWLAIRNLDDRLASIKENAFGAGYIEGYDDATQGKDSQSKRS